MALASEADACPAAHAGEASVQELARFADYVRVAIDRNLERSRATAAGRTSQFWAAVFAERPSYPNANGLMAFRREGFAYGIGDDRQGNLERERDYDARMHHIFRRMINPDLLAHLPEPMFGSPLAFEHDGVTCSASFRINAATTQRILESVGRYGPRGPLRVLEIGAGWGAVAYQLHRTLDIESYTIVDLPENLYLSTIYLANVLPERRVEIADVDGPAIMAVPKRAVAGCLPGTIARIEAKFDLVVNSFSLQEMGLDSVRAYLDWIDANLSKDGIFISLNSHGKAGVRLPSDYGYGRFHIHQWNVFRKSPTGFFNTIPYAVVAGRRRADSPSYASDYQNALGCLMQFGLDVDLIPWCEAFVAGAVDARQGALLAAWAKVFSAQNDDERERHLKAAAADDGSAVAPFVAAHWALLRNDAASCRALLQDAIAHGLGGFARARAEVIAAGLGRPAPSRWRRNAQQPAPMLSPVDDLDVTFAYPEAMAILMSGDLGAIATQADRIFRGAVA